MRNTRRHISQHCSGWLIDLLNHIPLIMLIYNFNPISAAKEGVGAERITALNDAILNMRVVPDIHII